MVCISAATMNYSVNNQINKNVSPEYEEFVRNAVQVYLDSLEQKRRPQVEPISPISYTREIRLMMHAFGDCKKPMWESVFYVEKILRQQINLLLTKAAAVTALRNGPLIEHEDLLFLLREKQVKLKRLLEYLAIKDTKELIKIPKAQDKLQNPAKGKRIKSCLDFLSIIDNFLSYESLLEKDEPDPVVQARNERKFAMVEKMEDAEYLEFQDIVQVTFVPQGREKIFMNYVLEDRVTNLNVSSLALEIINYFARDIVCTVVDLVMNLREEKSAYDEQQETRTESAKPAEKKDHSEREGESSKTDTDDASKQQEYNPITSSEIREAIYRYAKDGTQKNFLQKENADMVLPDILLCC